jgi:RHH-type transcriptional regulator, rel operon repressor / antitoxin RelB
MPTTVRLSADIEARLDRLVRRTGRSKAYYLRTMIDREMDRIEWEFDLLARVEDVRSGRSQTTSLAEVVTELGLDD